MFPHEIKSNVEEWVSQYPQHSRFIHANEHVFGRFPPSREEDGAWEQMVGLIQGSDESGKSIGPR